MSDEAESVPFEAAHSYQLTVPARAEIVDRLGERVAFEANAGEHTPKSEQEEAALEHLRELRLAKRDDDPSDHISLPEPPGEAAPETPESEETPAPKRTTKKAGSR